MRSFFEEIYFTFKAVKEDYTLGRTLDPSVKSKADIILFSASFHGLVIYRFSHLLWKSNLNFFAMYLRYLSRVLYKMDIHPAAEMEFGVFIDHGIGVVIGETASVGKGTLIYHGVTLGSARVMNGKRHPTVGRNVFIGANASILGPVTIGDGSKIGANSVVLHDVPPNSTVVGNPGHIIHKNGEENFEINDSHRQNTCCELENYEQTLVKAGKDKSRW